LPAPSRCPVQPLCPRRIITPATTTRTVSAARPLASNDPYPWFDETHACQDRVRGELLSRNRDGDAYLEFVGVPARDEMGVNRERISREGWARNRGESRQLTYECVLIDRTNRVVSSSYEMRGRGRYSQVY
jgi:hypothetical protein